MFLFLDMFTYFLMSTLLKRKAYERTTNIYKNETDPKGPIYIVNGIGGTEEGLYNKWLLWCLGIKFLGNSSHHGLCTDRERYFFLTSIITSKVMGIRSYGNSQQVRHLFIIITHCNSTHMQWQLFTTEGEEDDMAWIVNNN